MTDHGDASRRFPHSLREEPAPEWTTGEESLAVESAPAPTTWRTQATLFAVTTLSVFFAGALAAGVPAEPPGNFVGLLTVLFRGWTFAVPLLTILLVHEFGHYIAARIHRVDASLPYFLPLPIVSPLGTMGAVIAMRGKIRSRNALLDIGAAGPLAGLVVAIPVLMVGLSLSPVISNEPHYVQEGQSLLYFLLKWIVVGPLPEGHDVLLHPTAFAGWAGLLVTMLNLLPWGQLDGGHVAFALFGHRQHRYARWFRLALIPLFVANLAVNTVPVLLGRSTASLATAVGNSLWWLVWFALLGVIARMSGGADHPPVEPGELSPKRRVIAWCTLAFFVLLFIPTAPLSTH